MNTSSNVLKKLEYLIEMSEVFLEDSEDEFLFLEANSEKRRSPIRPPESENTKFEQFQSILNKSDLTSKSKQPVQTVAYLIALNNTRFWNQNYIKANLPTCQ